MNPEKPKDSTLSERVDQLEKKTIEQEHRIFSIVKNLIKFGVDEPDKQKFKSAISSFVSYVLKRQTIIIILSILTGIMSFASIIIAYQSKNLLDEQNKKIDLQNQLVEADRRSSLVFLFNNIMDELGKELKSKDTTYNNRQKFSERVFAHYESEDMPPYSKISKSLIGRIISLSKRLKPYKEYNYETKKLNELSSPERAQLLNNLLESGLDKPTLNFIFSKGLFEYADLNKFDCFEYMLDEIKLNYANLKNSVLFKSSFFNSDFNYANFENSKFSKCNLQRASFSYANLKNASFDGGNLQYVDFSYADLSNANFHKIKPSNFSRMNLYKATLDSIIICQYNLRNYNEDDVNHGLNHDSLGRHNLFVKGICQDPIFNNTEAFIKNLIFRKSQVYFRENYKIIVQKLKRQWVNSLNDSIAISFDVYRSIIVKK